MSEKVPRLVATVDIRHFKLDPTDGFLLTRIDGRLSPKQLAQDTGLPEFSVTRALEKLEKLGVVELVDPNAPKAPPAAAEAPRPRAVVPTFASIGEAKYDAAELDEEVDLPHEQRKRILDLFYRLEDLDHYTLLGVGRDADKKGIKRSYFELAAAMHPDRYFKKNLGSFKSKMEALFGRVTEAHDTLVDATKRADYDAYLSEVATTRGMEAMLERALEESRRALDESTAAAAAAAPVVSATAPPPSGRTSQPDGSGLSAEEMQARRQALARRLLGGSVRPPGTSAPPPAPNPHRYGSSADAVEALRRRYEERVENVAVAQARKHIQAGEEALLRNDLVGAATSFNIATKFVPDDVALASRYQETKNEADKVLCDSYVRQAEYEEREGHWPEAARSWQKVAKLKGSEGQAFHRAAACLLKAGGDLHAAAEQARLAVGLAPDDPAHHATLAEIYLAAGKLASAKGAAEAGLAVDPTHAALLAIVKNATK